MMAASCISCMLEQLLTPVRVYLTLFKISHGLLRFSRGKLSGLQALKNLIMEHF